MNKPMLAAIAMLMALGVSAPAGARAAQIFVAPTGNDTNPGRLE